MPLGYEYKRYFIILQEEDKGYEMTAGKIPTGYVKIEIKKNKVKAGGFIQNMKSDTKSQYKLILLAPGKKLALDTGLFRMDGTGRGEFYAEFDSDNVLGSRLSIDEFTGALVAAGSGTPLVGYTGRDSIQWRDWYFKNKEEKAEQVAEKRAIEEKEEMVEAEEREPEPEEAREEEEIVEIADAGEVREIVEIEEAGEEITEVEEAEEEIREIEKIREKVETDEMVNASEIKEMVEAEEARKEEIVEIEETREEESIVEPEIELNEDLEMRAEPAPLHYSFHGGDTDSLTNGIRRSDKYKKEKKESECKANKELINALRNMERFDGFQDEYGLRWYRLGYELPLLNDVIIPINGAMMPLSYPYMAETGGKNIRNCVLGVEHRKGEIRYVYIGIPGGYNEGCKACLEYKGFTGYKRTRNKRVGYWIMCIDIIKGRVCRV